MIQRYRFSREGIDFLVNLLQGNICPVIGRNHSLSSRDKVLISLRYFPTGTIQLNDADIHGVSKATVSKVITQVVEALSTPRILMRFINFPMTEEALHRNQDQFYGTARFPKVVGVIDGTHIRIRSPGIDEEHYINRKGFHSLNVQIVFDAIDTITNVVAQWPGSVHDSRIFQQSGLWRIFEDGHLPAGQYHLLGDSGYPSKRWLLTPFLNPLPGGQTSYNRVVLACVVLHNICKQPNIPLPFDELDDDNDDCDQAQDAQRNNVDAING